MKKKKRNSQCGAAQAPLIIGLLLLGLALPAALRLVQQRQETRREASGCETGWSCGNKSCGSGCQEECIPSSECQAQGTQLCHCKSTGGDGGGGTPDCDNGQCESGGTCYDDGYCCANNPDYPGVDFRCDNGSWVEDDSGGGGGGGGGTEPTSAPSCDTQGTSGSCSELNCCPGLEEYQEAPGICSCLDVTDYRCTRSGTCVADPNGNFDTYLDCYNNCGVSCYYDCRDSCASDEVEANVGSCSGGQICCKPKPTSTPQPTEPPDGGGDGGGGCTNNGGDCGADGDCCSGICDLSGGMPGTCRSDTCEGTCKEEVPGNYNCASYGLVYGDGECQSGEMCCKERDDGLSDGTVCEVADTTAMANCSDCNSGDYYCEGTTCYCGPEPTSEPGDLEDGTVCEPSDTTAMANCSDCKNGYHKTSSTGYACGPLEGDCLDDGFDCSWIGGGDINCSNCCNDKHWASITKGYVCGPGELRTCQWDGDPDAGVCSTDGCGANEKSVGPSNCAFGTCCVPEQGEEICYCLSSGCSYGCEYYTSSPGSGYYQCSDSACEQTGPEIVDCQGDDQCVFSDECSGELKTSQKCDLVLRPGGGEYKYCCSGDTCDVEGTTASCAELNCCNGLIEQQEAVGLCKCVTESTTPCTSSACGGYGAKCVEDLEGAAPKPGVYQLFADNACGYDIRVFESSSCSEGCLCYNSWFCDSADVPSGCEDVCPSDTEPTGTGGGSEATATEPAGGEPTDGGGGDGGGGDGGDGQQGCKPCPDGSYADAGTTSYSCQTDGASLTDFVRWKEQYIKVYYQNEQIPDNELYGDYNCSGSIDVTDFILWKERYLENF